MSKSRKKTKKDLNPIAAANKSTRISGVWECSCNWRISLDIDAGELSEFLVNQQLAPHRAPGHKLTKVE